MNVETTAAIPLLEALRARPRKMHEFDVAALLGFGGEEVHKVWIRVATKREQDLALVGAHNYVAKLAKDGAAIASDPDVMLDAKNAYILSAVILDAKGNPVWPAGDIMMSMLSTESIAALLALSNQVRRIESPDPEEMSEAEIDAIVSLCEKSQTHEAWKHIPEAALAKVARVKLEQLVFLLSLKLATARRSETPTAEPESEEPDAPG